MNEDQFTEKNILSLAWPGLALPVSLYSIVFGRMLSSLRGPGQMTQGLDDSQDCVGDPNV